LGAEGGVRMAALAVRTEKPGRQGCGGGTMAEAVAELAEVMVMMGAVAAMGLGAEAMGTALAAVNMVAVGRLAVVMAMVVALAGVEKAKAVAVMGMVVAAKVVVKVMMVPVVAVMVVAVVATDTAVVVTAGAVAVAISLSGRNLWSLLTTRKSFNGVENGCRASWTAGSSSRILSG